jgi:hypothetical protein
LHLQLQIRYLEFLHTIVAGAVNPSYFIAVVQNQRYGDYKKFVPINLYGSDALKEYFVKVSFDLLDWTIVTLRRDTHSTSKYITE